MVGTTGSTVCNKAPSMEMKMSCDRLTPGSPRIIEEKSIVGESEKDTAVT